MKTVCKHFVFLVAITFATSCSRTPKQVDAFKDALNTVCTDSEVTAAEWDNVLGKLNSAMKQKGYSKGVMVNKSTISDEESLAEYMIKEKGIRGTAPKILDYFVEFSRLDIIMENSRSMVGYVDAGDYRFTDPLNALFFCGDAKTSYKTMYASAALNSDTTVCFSEVSNIEFQQNATGTANFKASKSSPIDFIFRAAISNTFAEGNKNNVMCFITDGILSGTNAQIVNNREWTRSNLPLLETQMNKAVSSAKEMGLECLVYRLESSFRGTYFDYKNGLHSINGMRPYYYIFIGAKKNLMQIDKKLSENRRFTASLKNTLNTYNMSVYEPVKVLTLKSVVGMKYTCGGKEISYKRKDFAHNDMLFVCKLNLKNLPQRYIEGLSRGLKLSYIDGQTKQEVVISDDWLKEIDVDSETVLATLTIQLDAELLKKFASTSKMTLSMSGYPDDWYNKLSCSDDSQIYDGELTTFGLERFIGGIIGGFKYDQSKVFPDPINATFTIQKK